jgi:gamma-carbonic anhydrase
MNPITDSPLMLPYEGVVPRIDGPLRACGPGAAVLGKVTLGARAELAAFATLRGDGHVIAAGDDFHLGEHGTVHIAHAVFGTNIGHRVSVGAHAVAHACTLGDEAVVQDGALVLDGAVVGAGSIVAAGSVVFSRKEMPPGHWCEGVPAVPVRPLAPGELQAAHQLIRSRPIGGSAGPRAPVASPAEKRAYVSSTVVGEGELRMGEGSSLWFGCVVQADKLGVDIAAGANVQDNSLIRSTGRAVVVGPDCTVGHNVTLHDCEVGARVLVGMGSLVAPGTVIGDDVLLAGGSTTVEGQRLESGWMWGGRPARAISPLDERKAELIRRSALTYREYAAGFAAAQAKLRENA